MFSQSLQEVDELPLLRPTRQQNEQLKHLSRLHLNPINAAKVYCQADVCRAQKKMKDDKIVAAAKFKLASNQDKSIKKTVLRAF